MDEDRMELLHGALVRLCKGFSADEAVRGLASVMTTIVLGKDAAGPNHEGLDRLVAALLQELARPADAA